MSKETSNQSATAGSPAAVANAVDYARAHGRPFIELRELKPGTRFMFYADDLPNRGPCTLIEKGPGSAVIEYAPHDVVKTIKFRDKKDGQVKTREIRQTLSGRSRCALGAQVVPL